MSGDGEPGRARWPLLLAAAWLVLAAMLSSFTPTPLYPLYRETWGLEADWVSLAFAAYPTGVVLVLVLLGGLSDRWGRRATLRLAAAMILLSLVVLAAATGPAAVVVGRLIQGFATALTTGAAAAALMEAHPHGVQAGALVNTLCISAGCAVGPSLAGLVADRSDDPLSVPYLVVAAVTVPALALLLASPADRRVGEAALVRRVRVPRGVRRPFLVASLSILLTNTCMGLYGSFGADLAAAVGWGGGSATGWLVSAVFVASALVQVAARARGNLRNIRLGAAACVVGWALTTAAVVVGGGPAAGAGAVLGAAVVGAGAGLNLLGSAGLVGAVSPDGSRAELYSAYLCVAFSGLGFTALGAGLAFSLAPVEAVALGATGVAALLGLGAAAAGARGGDEAGGDGREVVPTPA